MAKARDRKTNAKRLAGVKAPKTARRSGGVKTFLTSNLGREILADVLIAAAGAAASALTRSRKGRKEAQSASGEATESDADRAMHHLAETATGALAGVLGGKARNMLPTSGESEGQERPRSARSMNKASGLESRRRSKDETGEAGTRRRRRQE